jgi:hypothetical protein
MRVNGEPGDRSIVKFSYEEVYDNEVDFWSLESFGLSPFIFEFDVPHVGSAGSYHLSVTFPPPLAAGGALIYLYEPEPEDDEGRSVRVEQIRYSCDSAGEPPKAKEVELFANVAARQAKFYAWGQRPGLRGKVLVATKLALDDFLASAALAAGALTAILVLFTIWLGKVATDRAAGAAVLLIAPAVFVYFLSSPSEHFLAGPLLRGLRRLIVLASGCPLLAAGLLVVGGTNPPSWVHTCFIVFSSVAGADTLALVTCYGLRGRIER